MTPSREQLHLWQLDTQKKLETRRDKLRALEAEVRLLEYQLDTLKSAQLFKEVKANA